MSRQADMYRDDLIRAAMAAQRLTNQKLAEKAGLSAFTVSLVRNGSPTVRLSTLKAIADALGISLADLFADPFTAKKQKAA